MPAQLLRDAVAPQGMAVPAARQVNAEQQSSAGPSVPYGEHSRASDGHACEEAPAQHADASSGEPGHAGRQADALNPQPPEGVLGQQDVPEQGREPDAQHQQDPMTEQEGLHQHDGQNA